MSEEYYPRQLKGRYELREKLGEGGMGAVFRCHDHFSQFDYAVKFLTVDHVLTSTGVQRFVHEARLLSHLQHPNIVQIHDYGVEEGIPYLIMELCLNEEGTPFTLKELQDLSPDRQLSVEHLLKILPQMLASVSLLHNHGLIHRDLKPENFLLKADADGYLIPKLSDFGLVAITGDEDLQRQYELSISLSLQDSTTKDRAWVGTYAFMSPEQKRGEQLDARSDVYSLGLIIYRLATGYERLSPELPSEINPQLPEWLDFLVEGALSEDPAERWLTAGKMYETLPPNLRNTPTTSTKLWRGKFAFPLYTLLILVMLLGIYVGLMRLVRPLERSDESPTASLRPQPLETRAPIQGGDASILVQRLGHPDPQLRAEAATQLVAHGPGALTALHVGLQQEDPILQRQAALVLGRIGHLGSVQPLIRALGDADDTVRRAAAEALGMIGQPAVPALGEALLSEDPQLRAYAVYGLSQIGEVGWPAWVTGLSSLDPTVRRQAVETLTQAGEASAPGLLQALARPPPASQHAHNILITIGQPIVDDLITDLDHPDPNVRRGICLVLAELKPAQGAINLTELLKDPNAEVRRASHQALVAIGEPASVPLVRLFREADPIVCDRARIALADLGAPAVPALMQALYSGTESVRGHVSQTLIQIGQAATLPLTEALHEDDPEVRQQAALTLASLPSSDALRSLIIAAQHRDQQVRQPARRALAALGSQSAPYLVDLLDNSENRLQRQVQVLLVQIGTGAVPALHEALKSPSLQTRILAAETLVYLKADTAYSAILTALVDPMTTNDALPTVVSERTSSLIARLFQTLQSADTPATRAAAESNLLRTGSHAVPVLVEILQTSPPEQATEAARLLGQLRHHAALPALLRILLTDTTNAQRLHLTTAEALGNLGNLAAIPALANAVRWKDWELRREAVRSLGKMRHEAAIPALTLALRDEKSDVRAAAAEALGLIGSSEALPALRRAIQDPNSSTRNNAALAIRRIQKDRS